MHALWQLNWSLCTSPQVVTVGKCHNGKCTVGLSARRAHPTPVDGAVQGAQAPLPACVVKAAEDHRTAVTCAHLFNFLKKGLPPVQTAETGLLRISEKMTSGPVFSNNLHNPQPRQCPGGSQAPTHGTWGFCRCLSLRTTNLSCLTKVT